MTYIFPEENDIFKEKKLSFSPTDRHMSSHLHPPVWCAVSTAIARRRRLQRMSDDNGSVRKRGEGGSGGPMCESSLAPCSSGAASSYWLWQRGASRLVGAAPTARRIRGHSTCKPRLWLRRPERQHQ